LYDPNGFAPPPAKKQNANHPSSGQTTSSAGTKVTLGNTVDLKDSIMTELRAEIKQMFKDEISLVLQQCTTIITELLASFQPMLKDIITTKLRNALQPQ
jgi:hypothetical protein